MSESSVALTASRYRQYALLIAGLWVGGLFMLLPLSGSGYLLAGVLLTLWFYALMCTWPQPFRATVLHIDQHGALYWQQQVLASGQLSQRSLITNWLLLLDWQDSQGQMHQLCLFRDQLTEQDYRALARQLQLQRWRGPSVNR